MASALVLIASIHRDIVEGCTNIHYLKEWNRHSTGKDKGYQAIFAGGVFVMYARHFFHLKQIQMRHTLLFGPIFVGAAIIALFLFLLNMTPACIRRTAKKCIFACTVGILFLMIWCQDT